jgi:hypothetical protein
MRGIGVSVIEMVERAPRCFAVMAAGVLHRRRLGAKARQQRHLPRQPGAQGVDGGQAQAPRLLLDGQSRCAERASAARARSKVTRLCGASGGTPVRARARLSAMRLRISPAALLVKVMATISSGSSAIASRRR